MKIISTIIGVYHYIVGHDNLKKLGFSSAYIKEIKQSGNYKEKSNFIVKNYKNLKNSKFNHPEIVSILKKSDWDDTFKTLIT